MGLVDVSHVVAGSLDALRSRSGSKNLRGNAMYTHFKTLQQGHSRAGYDEGNVSPLSSTWQ